MDENSLARHLSKVDHRRCGIWAFLCVFIIAVSLFTVLKPYYIAPLSFAEVIKIQPKKFEPFLVPICNFSEDKSDFCEIKGDIRIQGNSSSIFFTSPQLVILPDNNTEWTIKLYARKTDEYAMEGDQDLMLKPAPSDQEMPRCTVNHEIPAVVFSARGYSGNLFHDFSDIMIPLYLTSSDFNGEVQFLFETKHQWWSWINKYIPIFNALSKHKMIDLDNDEEIRCFNNVIIGLKSHRDFDIDSSRNFTQFVRKAYSLERETAIKLTAEEIQKPRLLIISRKETRLIVNEDEVAAAAQGLGFDVVVSEATLDLMGFSRKVNSFDVMMGVHGSGLTNMVFLPENSVLIQVIPLGLEWLAKAFFERPSKDMTLNYLEYKISERESSLIEEYPIEHSVIKDPSLIKRKGYRQFKSIYLEGQNVRLDINKFREVLLEALQLLNG